jgi:hypothetical protein
MLTVKHIESNHEGIVLAQAVSYYPDGEEVGQPNRTPPLVRAFGVVGGGVNGDGVHAYTNGRIYVMNDGGKTVAAYDLDIRGRSQVCRSEKSCGGR